MYRYVRTYVAGNGCKSENIFLSSTARDGRDPRRQQSASFYRTRYYESLRSNIYNTLVAQEEENEGEEGEEGVNRGEYTDLEQGQHIDHPFANFLVGLVKWVVSGIEFSLVFFLRLSLSM